MDATRLEMTFPRMRDKSFLLLIFVLTNAIAGLAAEVLSRVAYIGYDTFNRVGASLLED